MVGRDLLDAEEGGIGAERARLDLGGIAQVLHHVADRRQHQGRCRRDQGEGTPMTPERPTDDEGEQAAATWARTGQPRPAAAARETIPSDPQALAEDIERTIEASGIEWTYLRAGMFALNARHFWGPQIRAGDVVRWPYLSAPTAPTSLPWRSAR